MNRMALEDWFNTFRYVRLGDILLLEDCGWKWFYILKPYETLIKFFQKTIKNKNLFRADNSYYIRTYRIPNCFISLLDGLMFKKIKY